ncbi:MAG: mlaF [Francisellaceae bacterium]|nr:mlaF [Francisellaceae bacterium]
MGPSGCGKTTLLHLITGMNKPTARRALIFDQNIAILNRNQLFQLRRRMGMLFQSAALFLDLNVFDNIAFPLRELNCLSESIIRDIVLIKLEAIGLRGAKYLSISDLSGGMKRRVALARAIATDPELLLLDEPFAGQDPITMGVLTQLIDLINKSFKTTIVLVSHTIQNTFQIADYIYLAANERIMGEGSPQQLLNNNDPWVQQFIKGLADGPVHFHYPANPLQHELDL